MNHFFKEKRLSSMINFFEDNRFSSRLRAFLRFLSKIIEDIRKTSTKITKHRRLFPRRKSIIIAYPRFFLRFLSKIIEEKRGYALIIDFLRSFAIFFEEN